MSGEAIVDVRFPAEVEFHRKSIEFRWPRPVKSPAVCQIGFDLTNRVSAATGRTRQGGCCGTNRMFPEIDRRVVRSSQEQQTVKKYNSKIQKKA